MGSQLVSARLLKAAESNVQQDSDGGSNRMCRMSSTVLCAVTLLACVLTFRAAHTSCKGRCGAEFRRGDVCQCDYGCLVYGECCKDFESLCTTDDSCKGRCGETFKRGRSCSCDSECLKYNQCCPDHNLNCDAEEPTVSEATEPPTLSEGNNADDPSIPLVNPASYPPDGLSDDMNGHIFPNDEFSNNDLEASPVPESSSGYGSSTVDLQDQITAEPTMTFSTETFTVFSPTQVMFSDNKPTKADTENTGVSDPTSSSNPGTSLPQTTSAADQVSTPTSAPQTESPPTAITSELAASSTPTGPTEGSSQGLEDSQVTTAPSSMLDPTSIPEATTSNPQTQDPTGPPPSLADPKDESTSVSPTGMSDLDTLMTPSPSSTDAGLTSADPLRVTPEPTRPSPSEATSKPQDKPETVAEPSSKPETVTEPSSKPETVTEPSSKPETVTEPSSKPETVTEPSSKPETVTEPSSKPETVTEPSSKPNTVAEPSSKPETVTEPSSKPETVTEPSSKPETVTEPSSKPETVTEASSKPDTVTEPSSKPNTVAEPSSKPETVTEPSSKPETVAEPSSKPETLAKPSSKPETVAKPSSKPETVAKPGSKPETVAKPSSKPETVAKPSSKPETKPLDPAQTLDDPRDYQADDSNDTNLCSGRPVSGVTTLRNGTMVVFRGHYFWVLDRYMVPGPARGITHVWGVPSPIDTVFTRCNCQGKTYIFKGSQYWRFENDALDPNYPKVVETGFDGLRGQITAALSVPQYQTRRESVYFFKKGGLVQKYSYQFGTSPTCSKKVQPNNVHTVRYRLARQAVSVLGPAVNVRTSWRGFPSTITAAVSVPSVREPQGYKYYVFSRSKSYNVRMDSERPVIPPTANASPQSNDFFKCQKKV